MKALLECIGIVLMYLTMAVMGVILQFGPLIWGSPSDLVWNLVFCLATPFPINWILFFICTGFA